MDDAARPWVGDAQELVDAATRLHHTVQSVRLPTGGPLDGWWRAEHPSGVV